MVIEDELAMVDLKETGMALVQAINTAELTEGEKQLLVSLHSIIVETLRNVMDVANMQ